MILDRVYRLVPNTGKLLLLLLLLLSLLLLLLLLLGSEDAAFPSAIRAQSATARVNVTVLIIVSIVQN